MKINGPKMRKNRRYDCEKVIRKKRKADCCVDFDRKSKRIKIIEVEKFTEKICEALEKCQIHESNELFDHKFHSKSVQSIREIKFSTPKSKSGSGLNFKNFCETLPNIENGRRRESNQIQAAKLTLGAILKNVGGGKRAKKSSDKKIENDKIMGESEVRITSNHDHL